MKYKVTNSLTLDKVVASSSALMLAYAIGGFFGPVSASLLMAIFGNSALFNYLSVFCIIAALVCVFLKEVKKAS